MMLAAKELSLAGRLDSVSTSLQPGQITAICGPNGAGKSTLLNCLAGLLVPDSGTVELAGTDIGTIHPRARAKAIGYLAQDGEIAWDMAVRNLVALGRMPHDDATPAKIESAMATLDLIELADRPVSMLSGGEKARTLLARVLAGEPQWILADEPLAALDLSHQLGLLQHLRDVAGQGSGVVLVLHDLGLAMNHADRVLVLDDGKLTADAPPQEALSGEVIRNVWKLDADWLGDRSAKALLPRGLSSNS